MLLVNVLTLKFQHKIKQIISITSKYWKRIKLQFLAFKIFG